MMDIKLTKADRIIIKNLVCHARILERELAQKCNLSKDSVRYRIKRLEDLGVIRGYGAFIDYTKLGYASYKLYLKLNATIKQKEELVSFLSKQKHVFSIFESSGNWDVAMAIFAKSREEYFNFENKIISKYGKLVSSKKFCLMLDAIIFDKSPLYQQKNESEFNFWKYDSSEKIDAIDKKLLGFLNKNSKETLVSLATKVGLSADSVSKRIKSLERKKIISFYPCDIDYNLLGYEKYKLFVYVRDYSKEIEEEFYDFMRKKDPSLNIIRMIGPWKFEAEFLVKSHEEFQQLLSLVQEKFQKHISRLDFSIFRNEVWFPSDNLLI